jgi:hypothetical protein
LKSPTNILWNKSKRASQLREVVANVQHIGGIVGDDALQQRLHKILDTPVFVAAEGKTYPPSKFELCGRKLLLEPEEHSKVRLRLEV